MAVRRCTAIDSQGRLQAFRVHTPFGESLLHPDATDDQGDYTGHIRDKSSGLTYMQARYYDPLIGRFMGEDPVTFVGSGGDPRYFNRYAYAGNEPIGNTDPNGRQIRCDVCRFMKPGQLESAGKGLAKGGMIAAETAVDFTPIIGDAKAVGTAIINPTKSNIAAAGIGFIPIIGDLAGKGIKIATKQLNGQGFETVLIDGDTFVQKTFETSAGNIDFAAKVGGDGKSLQLTELQIFTENGTNPGITALRELDRGVSGDIEAAGFGSVKASGTRLSGAKEGEVVTIEKTFNQD